LTDNRYSEVHSAFIKSVIVAMGVSKLGRMDLYLSMLKWNSVARTAVGCFWLKSYCLSCLRSVKSSLSFSKAVFPLTACETINLLERDTSVHFSRPFAIQSQVDYRIWGECSSGSSKFMTLMNWTSAWSTPMLF